jgi:hypothetical protein
VAYPPEGSWTRRRPIGRDYAAAKDAECGKQEKVQGIKERYKTEGIRFKVKVNRENPIQFVFIPVLVLVIRNFSRTRDEYEYEYDDEGRACRAEVITKAAAGPINPKSEIRNRELLTSYGLN